MLCSSEFSIIIYLSRLKLFVFFFLFSQTFQEVYSKADEIWKFRRYRFILTYASYPPIPPPFSIIYYVIKTVLFLYNKLKSTIKYKNSSKVQPNSNEINSVLKPIRFTVEQKCAKIALNE